MPTYKYKGTNKEGKKVNGIVEAANEREAAGILKDKGYNISSFEEKKSGLGGDINIVLDRVKPKDIVAFSRQFAVLISANVALVQSLRMMVDQTGNQKMKMKISSVADEVDEGSRLSDALAKQGKVFSDFYVNVVRSGETSGRLDEVLDYLADELEKDYDMMSKIKGAMIYPVFVLCGLTGVGVVMMVYVVPKLTAVLEETGGELPAATKILMATSDFMANSWYILIAALVAVIVGFKLLLRLPLGKMAVDRILLRMPIFGKLFARIYLVRFTRSLQTLLVGGVSISKALAIVANVVSNSEYKDLITRTKEEVEDGNSISSVFSESKIIPDMVSQMMGIGEKTGRLDMILEKITDFYTREINNVVANLMTLMEPIIMVIMGVAVGIMVAAIILPMYNMASTM